MMGGWKPEIENLGNFKTLIGLVERYSPSGDESAAVNWLVEHFKDLGYTQSLRDDVGNAVGVMGTGTRQIVLLGHIDTVPGEIKVGVISKDAVIARHAVTKQSHQIVERLLRSARNDAILFGRGSVDAKGPLAAFVDAVAAVGPVDGWQFVVIGAIDEERDSVGARYAVDQYRPEFAIIGEPSQWDRVTLGYKGSAWAEVIVTQSMAHTAGEAQSAPEIAVEIWDQITTWAAAFNAERERKFDQITPTLRGFSSSEDGFKVTATLQIGVRLPVGFDPPDWYEKLKGWATATGAELHPKGFPIPAYLAERNSALVRAFLGGIRSVGGKPGFVVKTGTADLNIVAPVWGCPAVAYGPGDSSLDHTPGEHILLDEYRQAVKILQAVLERLAQ